MFDPSVKWKAILNNQMNASMMNNEQSTVDNTPHRKRFPGVSIHDTFLSICLATKAFPGQSEIHKQKLKDVSTIKLVLSVRHPGQKTYAIRRLMTRQNIGKARLLSNLFLVQSSILFGSQLSGDNASAFFITGQGWSTI